MSRPGGPEAGGRKSLAIAFTDRETLLAHAYAIEHEAAERYQDLAEQMYGCGNEEVGGLFAKLAEIEAKHAAELSLERGAANSPMALADYLWDGLQSPEVIPFEEMHYLMRPHQALVLALAAERRALSFYEAVASQSPQEDMRILAAEFAVEEAEHVQLVLDWLQRYPEPDQDWDDDMDPPMSL
ncbi:MAG: ferritin family protein [Proteobacteria bacterium]|nr:ferritin family protein [Pseudomonadota bacterium]